MAQVRLLIGGVDRTAFLLEPPEAEWSVETQAFGSEDTFSFTLFDKANALTLTSGAQVILEKFSDSGTRYFGGYLTGVAQITDGLGKRITCSASGWMYDLHKTVVNQKFRGKSDQFIITDASTGIFLGTSAQTITKDLSAYTVNTSNVQEGNPNTNIMVFNGETIPDIMDTLADWSGFIWGVTPLQVVYYRPFVASISSQSLSDSPDESSSFPYYDFQIDKDFSHFINAVYVYGGYQTVFDQTRTYGQGDGADGTKTDFILPHKWRAPDSDTLITVEKSDGMGGWTAQTVGLPQEPGSFDVTWFELGQALHFASAPPNSTPSFRVTGNLFEQVIGFAKNQQSIDDHGEFQVAIKDASLRDEEAAERRARVELNKRAREAFKIGVTCDQDDFQVGTMIPLVNTIHGLNANYLASRMVMRSLGGGKQAYDLTLVEIPS